MIYAQRERPKPDRDSPGASALREVLRRRGPIAVKLHQFLEPSTLRTHAEGVAIPQHPALTYYERLLRVREGGRKRRVRQADFVRASDREAAEIVLVELVRAAEEERAGRRKTGAARGDSV